MLHVYKKESCMSEKSRRVQEASLASHDPSLDNFVVTSDVFDIDFNMAFMVTVGRRRNIMITIRKLKHTACLRSNLTLSGNLNLNSKLNAELTIQIMRLHSRV